MPDKAEVEHLARHASIWGVYRRAAVKAVGYAVFTGTPGLAVPLGLQLRTPGGGLVATSAAGVVAGARSGPAGADRDALRKIRASPGRVADLAADAFDDVPRMFLGQSVEDHAKLIAAKPRQRIAPTDLGLQQCADLS